jgi:hypothetical protein
MIARCWCIWVNIRAIRSVKSIVPFPLLASYFQRQISCGSIGYSDTYRRASIDGVDSPLPRCAIATGLGYHRFGIQ